MATIADWAMYTTMEEADIMAHLLGGDGSGGLDGGMLLAGSLSLSSIYDDNGAARNQGFGFDQDSRTSTFSSSYYVGESCGQEMNYGSLTLDLDGANTNAYLADEMSECNVGAVAPPMQQHVPSIPDDKCLSPSQRNKRSRGDVELKNKRNTGSRSRKNQKSNSENDEEETKRKGGAAMSSSGCNCSDDESNGSQEIMEESSNLSPKATKALNLNGKTRAGRGAATDPQSLYARKRRERINERLRILQSLVPNGTKVDISTMLEEAVHYVKFLQLQIKLLSSDEHWMYAPIAYNGMDIGLDRKFNNARD